MTRRRQLFDSWFIRTIRTTCAALSFSYISAASMRDTSGSDLFIASIDKSPERVSIMAMRDADVDGGAIVPTTGRVEQTFSALIVVDKDGTVLSGQSYSNVRCPKILINPGVKKVVIENFLFASCGDRYEEQKTSHYSSALIHILGDTDAVIRNNKFLDTHAFQIIRVDGHRNTVAIYHNHVSRTAYRFVGVAAGSTLNSLSIRSNLIESIGVLAIGTGVGATAIYNTGLDKQRYMSVTGNIIRNTVENGVEGSWDEISFNKITGAGTAKSAYGIKYSTPSRSAVSTRGPALVRSNVLLKNFRAVNVYAPKGLLGEIYIHENTIIGTFECSIFVRAPEKGPFPEIRRNEVENALYLNEPTCS